MRTIHEDEEILVVDKPAGLLTHRNTPTDEAADAGDRLGGDE